MSSPNDRVVTIEQNKKLSDSVLWRVEREYFERKGIEAWLHEVPFYITSNTFIGKSYARIVIHFIRDWIAKHPEAKKHPFYVMETGTGPGQFSFYAAKALDQLRRDFGMDDVKIVYVMSDFAKANLDYHASHHALMPLIEQGLIDLAIHDMDKKTPIKLVNQKVELNQETLVNPLVLFANYVFDTISNDAFAVQNGHLYELLVNLSTQESNIQNNKPVNLELVNIDYRPQEIKSGSYYDDPAMNQVLELYRTSLQDTCLLFPVGSIRGLDHLRKLANGRVLLISSDKSYSELSSLDHLGQPSITAHGGCFSMMVNCHAIGQFFKNVGGDFFAQSTRRGLKTCIYTAGVKLDELPETRVAVQDYVEKFSPTDYFNVYRHMNETAQHGELDMLASYLQMTEWDPKAYMRIVSHVLAKIGNGDEETIEFLANHLPILADNYYYMPMTDCILFDVATFFHAIKRYDQALNYYQKSHKFLGEQFSLYYNIGLCQHHLEQNQDALESFKRALSVNPESSEAQQWIEYLSKMFRDMKFEPKRVVDNRGDEESK